MNKSVTALLALLILATISNFAAAYYTLSINEPEVNPLTESWVHEINPLKVTKRAFLDFNINTTRWENIDLTVQNTDSATDQNALVYVQLYTTGRRMIASNGDAGTQVTVPAGQELTTGAIKLTWSGNYTATDVVESSVTLYPQYTEP